MKNRNQIIHNHNRMQRRNFIRNSSLAAIAGAGLAAGSCAPSADPVLGKTQIQHGVIFTLKHERSSAAAKQFLEDGRRILTGIPVVQHFQVFDQVSKKNDYQYGFTMVFDSMEDYQAYNEHPDHIAFVEERWMKEVEKFLEIDFEVYG